MSEGVSERLELRLTADEKQAFTEAAGREGFWWRQEPNLSEWIRQTCGKRAAELLGPRGEP